MASTTSPRGRIYKSSRSDDCYMQRQRINTDKTMIQTEKLVCMWNIKKNPCCWAPSAQLSMIWLLYTDTVPAYANTCWHRALGSSFFNVEMMQKWWATGRKPWKDTGTTWGGNWREKTDSGGGGWRRPGKCAKYSASLSNLWRWKTYLFHVCFCHVNISIHLLKVLVRSVCLFAFPFKLSFTLKKGENQI